jgi:hypothetical protein
MRTSKLDRLVILTAAGLFSTALLAGGDKHAATFDSLDKNADQQISKAEAQGHKDLSDGFASADTNGDGYLNKAEFEKSMSSWSDMPKESRTPAERPAS